MDKNDKWKQTSYTNIIIKKSPFAVSFALVLVVVDSAKDKNNSKQILIKWTGGHKNVFTKMTFHYPLRRTFISHFETTRWSFLSVAHYNYKLSLVYEWNRYFICSSSDFTSSFRYAHSVLILTINKYFLIIRILLYIFFYCLTNSGFLTTNN